MDVNAAEVAPNTLHDLDEFLRSENFVVRLLYRANGRQMMCFIFLYMIALSTCLIFLLYELDTMGVDEVIHQVVIGVAAFVFSAFSAIMWWAFKKKEENIRKFRTSENEQPMTDEEREQFRRLLEELKKLTAQLKSDKAKEQLRQLLLKMDEDNRQLRRLLEEQKKLPARKAEVYQDDCEVEVVLPVVKEGSDTKVAGHLKSIQIHRPPVGSPESSNSSETFGKGHDTAASSEKHDSSRSGEVSDSAVSSNNLDRISIIETEEENSEVLPTKSDEPEQWETKESAGSSALETMKHSEKNDSQTCGGDDRQSSLEESDAVNGMSLRNDDESVNTASSYSPPTKKVRPTSV